MTGLRRAAAILKPLGDVNVTATMIDEKWAVAILTLYDTTAHGQTIG
jgi:hypothetical protein